VKFLATDSGKNIEIVSKSLEKPLLLLNTANFTLQIIENTEKQYSFRNQRRRLKISDKIVKILAFLVAPAISCSLMCCLFKTNEVQKVFRAGIKQGEVNRWQQLAIAVRVLWGLFYDRLHHFQ